MTNYRLPDSEGETSLDNLRSKPEPGMIGLLIVEMIIGYEWFISGLVKVVRGGFPAGLADELIKKAPTDATWYGAFLKSAVIPNAVIFGYLVEISEILAGVALIVGPLVWIFGVDRIARRSRALILLATAVAATGGAFLAINLHLANAASHPWLFPGDSFDEGIDLDSILPAIQIVIATVSVVLLRRIRGQHNVVRNAGNVRELSTE